MANDGYSGLTQFSAHNIPVRTHPFIVINEDDGSTVLFVREDDAERFARKQVRMGSEESKIFKLAEHRLFTTTDPKVFETTQVREPAPTVALPLDKLRQFPEGVVACVRCDGSGFVAGLTCQLCEGKGWAYGVDHTATGETHD